ncbi:MAG: glycosyltransferase [Actinomycetota bacterium]
MTRDDALFLVWGPPSHGPRSKVFARELGIDVEFVEATRRRGLLAAPYKYPVQLWRTIRLLHRRRPRMLFVQSPPSPAVATAAVYGALTGSPYVIDAHSAAFLSPIWTRPRWLNRLLFRRALVTIVTNEHFADLLASMGASALVLRDIPTEFERGPSPALGDGFHVMVVNTFSFDEPLEEVVEAARELPAVTFHVTGRVESHPEAVPASVPPNLRFTGFLSDPDYYALMQRADAVVCLTTRDHTMQRGACEALSMGRPIITSDSSLLRSYFDRGTLHVDNRADSIGRAVEAMREGHARYLEEIEELRLSQLREWDEARWRLQQILESVGAGVRSDDVA